MGRVPYSEFVGSRVRFQRLSDQHVFAGWLKTLRGESATVTAEDDIPIEQNERFLCQVQGPSADAYFIAAMCALPTGANNHVNGATALQRVSLPALDYEFRLITQVQFRDAQQHARKSIQALVATCVNSQDRQSEFLVTDASAGGMGVIAWEEMKRGEIHKVAVQAGKVVVSFQCEVRHCRPEPRLIGAYRVGLKFQNPERVDLFSWRKLIAGD